ncbi:MAG: hypothetical protein ACK4ND_11045 [Cytophagaceae bacterium]
MVKHLVYIFLFFSITLSCFGQDAWMTRNLTNSSLTFLTHKDSISNLYEIKNGLAVIIKDTINLKDSVDLYFELSEFYRDKVKTYLLYTGDYQKGLYTTLDFCYDRLIQINMYSNTSYFLSNFKLELQRNFKNKGKGYYTVSKDSTVNYGNTIVSYGERYSDYNRYGSNKRVAYQYQEDLIKETGYLVLADKKVNTLIPSWCGSCNGKKTWKKLKAYLDKNAP